MKIFVIGAGVSSLAFCSFLDKNDITVLESNQFSGRKLLATGNGRCNFTNINMDHKNFYSNEKDFVNYSLDSFSNKDLLEYFEYLGIEWINFPSGRCYPKTQSSKTVRDSLLMKAEENAKFIYNIKVVDIDFKKKLIITDKKSFKYDILVIASGGLSLKNSGSDGSILKILKKHTKLIDQTFGITNFKTENPLSKTAKGCKVFAKASLFVDDKFQKSSTDDIIFQSYGLTGTAILDLSNIISLALKDKRKIRLDIDFYPEYKKKGLFDILEKKAQRFPKRAIKNLLIGNIDQKLIIDILKRAKINEDSVKISKNDLEKLVKILKKFSFNIVDIHDKNNAQVTLGGVACDRIYKNSMKSKDMADTYFIGEIMDVAGDCGGYNIQWAFSSAKAASDDIRRLNV
ncbi:aminoacetone oxidase family FAD-binding enzyme [Anaerococcus sp. AGMB00486]|uniref:Aminoacetone oxidase family FAD-binding enzyme n=1 Tax=Anaerococcus faecalis TaxID=2742993 RepID=A0ABX2NA40_9FIRM|nr:MULTISPECIES: aminoacetone oxidase family FAD-binding enzyme [Anaerococcus]MDY3006728.1 aminoacetone oxidase family FAD-binding enzyme [Anaerococcus porci]NVF11561.1 aminoacetone oxidase family FAD-binding enzyme [Anaerococcus faecalis]